MGLIYKITNTITDQIYVGQTTKTLRIRFRAHKDFARAKRRLTYLSRAMNKYGADAFQITLLEECSDDILNDREQFWVAELRSNQKPYGYNMSAGGDNGNNTRDPEVRKRISQAKTGVKLGPMSEERKQAISRMNLGRKRTPEQIERIRNSREYPPLSEQHKLNIRAGLNRTKVFLLTLEECGWVYATWKAGTRQKDLPKLLGVSRDTIRRALLRYKESL